MTMQKSVSLRRILGLYNVQIGRSIPLFSSSTSLQQQQRKTSILSEAVRRRVEALVERHDAVVEQLNQGSGDVASLGKEMSSLAQVASLAQRLSDMQQETVSTRELLNEAHDDDDDDMVKICLAELEELQEARATLEKRILYAVLPRDEDDYNSNAILEIRAGTGGDEAALFTGELLQAYSAAAKSKGWTFDILSETKTDLGGTKEAAVSITSHHKSVFGYDASETDNEEEDDLLAGLGPFGYFRFESGVHRVQRVPINDSKIQTSACSVAVLPSPADDDKNDAQSLLPMSDLKIETMRASGAGGQHVNTTESAVRITHTPTGITAAIQDERSQHKNKAKALKLIAARVRDQLRETEARQRGDARNSLMGGGDRSERIRTYNFPQDRVTDHRCKHTENGIEKLFGGTQGLMDRFAPPLRLMHREELMKQLDEEEK